MRTILPHEENPALRKTASHIPISEIKSARIQNLIKEMKKLLVQEEYGVALAAPQVGEPITLFIVSGQAVAKRKRAAEKNEELGEEVQGKLDALPAVGEVYINPKLLKVSRTKKEKHEGCLSIRGKWGVVPRAEKATIRAYGANGKEFTRGASGFLAHIFQHEMDHLDGILYMDKATEIYDEERKEK